MEPPVPDEDEEDTDTVTDVLPPDPGKIGEPP
jgi:hypothetical protein